MQGAWAALTRKLCTICLALCQEHGCWPFFSLLCSSIAHFLAVSRMTGGGEPQGPHLPCPIFHALCIVGGARYPVSPGLLLAVVSQAKHALLVKLVWRGHGLGPGLHARLLKYQSQPPQHGKQWPDRKYHFSFLGR